MKNKHDDAVSEVLGAALLLAIAVVTVSVVSTQILSDPGPSPETQVTITGKLENGYPVFSHQRGEELGLDTEIILTLAGYDPHIFTPLESSGGSNLNDEWNIGERLAFSDLNNTQGLQVEATIIDKLSNSIVFWGILQEGEIIQGKGGIWHLNENGGTTAYDDSGYNNDGEIHGAKWEGSGKFGSALKFDGLNDYVKVTSSFSLYDSDAITVEAWMKSEPVETVLEDEYFEAPFAYNPDIIHISGDFYAIAARGQRAHEGVLITLNISKDGNVSMDGIHNNQSEFDHSWGEQPDIFNISDTIYGIAYQRKKQGSYEGVLTTADILPNGSINRTNIDNFTFDFDRCFHPSVTKIYDNVTAIVYTGSDDDGYLKTVEIFHNGSINKTIDGWEFETQDCLTPKIIQINDTIYSIVYTGPDDKGYLKTVEIFKNGTINKTGVDSWEFTTSVEVHQPDIIYLSEDNYFIAYQIGAQGNPDGVVISIEILSNGSIERDTATIIVNSIGIHSSCYEPCIIAISDQIAAIAYRSSTPHQGYITTVRIGSDQIPPYLRGVYKTGSYGIFANLTTAVALINEQVIFAPLVPNEWHHVAMTYNKTKTIENMKLYITNQYGTTIYSQDLRETIYWNQNDIIFGKLFCGVVDEIGIFAKELTLTEIQSHLINPDTMMDSII